MPGSEIVFGREYPIDRALAELRAALHEPMPTTTLEDRLGHSIACALIGQPGLIQSPEDGKRIGHALIVAAASAGVLALHGAHCAAGTINSLSLAGLHLMDGDVRCDCGTTSRSGS